MQSWSRSYATTSNKVLYLIRQFKDNKCNIWTFRECRGITLVENFLELMSLK